mgnify:CR=1 FL=1
MTGENGRKIYYENFQRLQPNTILTYKDEEETIPVRYDMTHDELGNITYEKSARRARVILYLSRRESWLLEQVIKKDGVVLDKATYTYDSKGNILTSNQTVNDPNNANRTTTYTYDGGADDFANSLERAADPLCL